MSADGLGNPHEVSQNILTITVSTITMTTANYPPYVSRRVFTPMCREANGDFTENVQHDAHELLMFLLSTLDDICDRLARDAKGTKEYFPLTPGSELAKAPSLGFLVDMQGLAYS